MTVPQLPQLLQLYAPLAGLLALAFWVGVLSQKVKGLEDDVKDLRDQGSEGGVSERIVRLEVQMEGMQASLEKIERGMEGVQRQLGNLMQKGGTITQMNP